MLKLPAPATHFTLPVLPAGYFDAIPDYLYRQAAGTIRRFVLLLNLQNYLVPLLFSPLSLIIHLITLPVLLIIVTAILLLFIVTNPSYKDFENYSADYSITATGERFLYHNAVRRKLAEYFIYSVYQINVLKKLHVLVELQSKNIIAMQEF